MKWLAMGLMWFSWNSYASLTAHFDHTHEKFTKILQAATVYKGNASQVNYLKLKEAPQPLEDYLASLSAVKESEFKTWRREEQMAFLINAYNGFTLKLIVDHYPVSSIKKIGGWFSSPWKKKFFRLFGRDFTLDEIEHEWLRPKYQEPRVHFAVNCASVGCPRLRNEAYKASDLENQLEDQARVFLRDTSRNQLLLQPRVLEVSKIFDWFKQDFKPSVQEFVIPRISDDKKIREQALSFALKYTEYDWRLNEVP